MQVDPALLQACQDGDRRSQSELYRTCYGLLMGVCCRYYKNKQDATAALNKGFLKIIKNLHRYQSNVPFEAWSRRIMINIIIDEYRVNKKKTEMLEYRDSFEEWTAGFSFNYNEADEVFELEELKAMIAELPPASQTIFNLHIIDGYSHQEISEKMKITEATSRWHIAKSRKALLAKMSKVLKSIQTYML